MNLPKLLAIPMLAAGLVLSGAAVAQDVPKVLKERQDQMRAQFRALKAVKDYLDGKVDQATATAGADFLVREVPKVPDLFPPGTNGIPPEKSPYRPKPDLWNRWDKFLADEKTVTEQIDALDKAVKGGDKEQIAALFKKLDDCDACHDDFRERVQQ